MLNNTLDDNFEWYKNHLQELYLTYGDCYLAIKNKTVIGVYQSYAEAVRKTSRKEELGTFNVQLCGPDEGSYTTYINCVA